MKLPKSDLDLEHRTSYRFAVVSAMSNRCVADLYRSHGLTVGGWRTLSLIGHYEPIYPGQIAERTSIEPDKVTRAVDRLVGIGYVARVADDNDRRRVVLKLTRSGRRVYSAIERVRREVEQELLAALSPSERKSFLQSLAKVEAQARRLFAGKNAWTALARKPGTMLPIRHSPRRPAGEHKG
jgi:DNA-binding MarR family transcriptional regulator